MKFIYNNQGTMGTYSVVDNPAIYTHDEVAIDNNERNGVAGLVSYNQGIYHVFNLSFQNIGTADYANLGTIFRTKNNITFFPMDEVRGTNENFTVRWIGDFSPKLSDSFWSSGFSLDMTLESI